MATRKVRVYPVPGYYIAGVPHVEQEVDEASDLLIFMLESGAFTTEPPEKQPEKPAEAAEEAEA